MNTLPDKPSELIKVALRDLELVEKDDRYAVDMNRWHVKYPEEDRCAVCLAGTVMAKSLNAPLDSTFKTTRFPPGVSHKLLALDKFRNGYVFDGFSDLNLFPPVKIKAIYNICKYEINSTQFKTEMLQLASDLEEAGY